MEAKTGAQVLIGWSVPENR